MEKTWDAHRRVEREGLFFREAKRVVEMELFLDEYPRWNIGSPHQSVTLHEMFLHAASHEGGKRQNVCAAGAAQAA